MIVLKTPNLDLRRFAPQDAEFFFDMNSDPQVLRYTGDRNFESVAGARQFIEDYDHYEKYGYGRWTVVLRKTNEAIGFCGLKYHEEEDYVDLGYRLSRKYWGNGYATEAAQACVIYGFQNLGLKEIVGRCAIENKASIRILQKLGMSFWKFAPCEDIENAAYYRIQKA